jgi:hypothetical protein
MDRHSLLLLKGADRFSFKHDFWGADDNCSREENFEIQANFEMAYNNAAH